MAVASEWGQIRLSVPARRPTGKARTPLCPDLLLFARVSVLLIAQDDPPCRAPEGDIAMVKPTPQAPAKITPETVARMTAEVVGTPVNAKDRRAVADMLQALTADMAALRRLNVGAAEPAFHYDAGATQ